ncbi:MAG: putative nucleic-acid-binding protein [Labilithrix sp.]|nr:putative nucleic-acid-binding protein [Labilithrix sp.]
MVDTKQHEERNDLGVKPGPRRQCAGCAKRDFADALLRVVLDPEDGTLAVDLADSRFGRGAHVHASKECMQKALRGGFAKVFKSKVEGTAESLAEQVVVAADRRIEGLITGARRGKLAIAGADVVREAYREGKAALIVVASDAAAAAKLPEVQDAIGQGKAIGWSNKQRLGAIFGRDETAVCAVLHEGVAEAIGRARAHAAPFATAEVRSEAWSSSEDR